MDGGIRVAEERGAKFSFIFSAIGIAGTKGTDFYLLFVQQAFVAYGLNRS